MRSTRPRPQRERQKPFAQAGATTGLQLALLLQTVLERLEHQRDVGRARIVALHGTTNLALSRFIAVVLCVPIRAR